MEKGALLFNCSHHERRPQGPRAAFRLLGGFASEREAREHSRSLPADCDVLLASIGAAFALTRSREKDEAKHLQALLQVHNRRLRDHEREFTENVAEQKTGEASALPGGEPASQERTEEEQRIPERIPRASEVRFQNYAVLSVMHDFDEACSDLQEPAVVVWGIYDTEDGAKEAIRKKHAAFVKDLHLEVCSLYEWLHPTEVTKSLDELEEEFRDETLTKIIAQRKQERQSVKAFRDLCGEKTAPLLDLSGAEVRRSGEALPCNIAELSEGATEVAPST
jgi:hypothetical protein